MLTDEMKEARKVSGKSAREVALALGLTSGEAYRLKEIGKVGITGAELALLARLYGRPMSEIFPSYEPTEGEALLVAELAA